MGNCGVRESSQAWMWLCPLISVFMAVFMGYAFGLSWWTALLMGALLACPIYAAWTYLISQRPLPVPLGPAPITGGTNFNWVAPWYDAWCSAFGLGKGFRKWILALVELNEGDRVLDVGCGNGVLTHRLAGIVGSSGAAWGIDPAPDMIRAAMQAPGQARPAAHFELAAIEALPFEDGSFDAAVISLVLHHLPQDLKTAGLKEVCRVLKPGGRLFVVEPDRPDHWFWRALLWPGRFYQRFKSHLEGRTPQLLANAGFSAIAVLGHWHHSITFWRASKSEVSRDL